MPDPVKIRFRIYSTANALPKDVDWEFEPDRPLPTVGDLLTFDGFTRPDGAHIPLYLHELYAGDWDDFTHRGVVNYLTPEQVREAQCGKPGVLKNVLAQLSKRGDNTVQGLLDLMTERDIPLTATIDYQDCGSHEIVVWSTDGDWWDNE